MSSLNASKICASNFSYFRFPLTRFLDDVVSLDVNVVELWGAAPHLYVDDATSADLRAIKNEIAQRGLKLACFTPEQCIYPINIAAIENVIRERSVDYFYKCLDVTAELDAPYLFLTSGWGYADEDPAESWKRSVDSIARIARHAEERGVVMVLEALQPCESNIVIDSDGVKRMIDTINSPSLKAALDTVGMAVAGETPKDYTAKFGRDLLHAHFIDGEPAGHSAWGEGNLPLKQYLQELIEGDYQGYLSFEFLGPRYWLDPIAPVRKSVDAIRSALKELGR
ncbi:sugar phosphate isomerase/epimerase family protein [Microvirga pakistanensis]|uniref:sugar phosphate isomerase/epimerase family protein n=1 Tax=Microvirga pakistanensis TaxID=1682650 RepID=UPI00106B0E57|nr:TIM barrel protein [Microvirga pakistanensis]